MVVDPRKVGVASERNPCGTAAVGCINLERQSSVIVVVRYEGVGIAASSILAFGDTPPADSTMASMIRRLVSRYAWLNVPIWQRHRDRFDAHLSVFVL